jgi:hypothetical protein
MTKNIASIVAPVLESDSRVEEALSRARATNAFGVVENVAGTFRLHPLYALENAAKRDATVTLGSLEGHQLDAAPQSTGQLRDSGDNDVSMLESTKGGIAIEGFTHGGTTTVARIIGFTDLGGYLPTVVRNSWYQCIVAPCPDKTRYSSAGTCAYTHPLARKP